MKWFLLHKKFYVQKQRRAANLVSNKACVGKKEIKILGKEILEINAKNTSFSYKLDKKALIKV